MKTFQWLKSACFSTGLAGACLILGISQSIAMSQEMRPAPRWMLGQISQKSTYDTTIVIVAKGETIVMRRAESNCSCLRVRMSERVAKPGDSISLRLTYDAKDKGHFYKRVTLLGNGLEWDNIIVRGEVR